MHVQCYSGMKADERPVAFNLMITIMLSRNFWINGMDPRTRISKFVRAMATSISFAIT
jgi:hypothetical protein